MAKFGQLIDNYVQNQIFELNRKAGEDSGKLEAIRRTLVFIVNDLQCDRKFAISMPDGWTRYDMNSKSMLKAIGLESSTYSWTKFKHIELLKLFGFDAREGDYDTDREGLRYYLDIKSVIDDI